MGRAWLLTVEQLADVWAQENGETVGPELDLAALVRDGSLDLGRGWYRRLVYLGELDGAPLATLTCDALPGLNAAGPGYLEVMGRGLMESWGSTASEAAEYLAGRDGNRGAVDVAALMDRLQGPPQLD